MLSSTRRLLLVGLALFACSTELGAVDPIWGKQACESCRMLVSNPAYAAELLDASGRRHFFDDIGCLDAYLSEHAVKPRAIWVRSGSRWVTAEAARYAAGAASPMDYGYVAEQDGPLDFASVRRGAAAHRKELGR
jgi:copper chaperone NosL